ncbi:MAG: hypothetical protein M1470_13880 [Bacteroidetes bacterium]|nr:hypothetical protein [Bacteroidota bacterium]
MTIGVIEPLAFGAGLQIDSVWAIGIKYCGYWTSGGTYLPNSGTGVGVRISEKIRFMIFDNINYEMTAFHPYPDQDSKALINGGAIDINMGRESNLKDGFNVIWSLGVTATTGEGSALLVLPNLKLGFDVNF